MHALPLAQHSGAGGSRGGRWRQQAAVWQDAAARWCLTSSAVQQAAGARACKGEGGVGSTCTQAGAAGGAAADCHPRLGPHNPRKTHQGRAGRNMPCPRFPHKPLESPCGHATLVLPRGRSVASAPSPPCRRTPDPPKDLPCSSNAWMPASWASSTRARHRLIGLDCLFWSRVSR